MTTTEQMQAAWNEWHHDIDPDLVPMPNPSFIRGFVVGQLRLEAHKNLDVKMKLKIQKLHENAVIPTYAHHGDACFDLTAATVDGHQSFHSGIYRDKPVVCGTGLAFEIPAGHVMLVFSRSGMGFKQGIRLANSVAVIDHGYIGEVMVKLVSDAPTTDRNGDDVPCQAVRPGDRIAQAMVIPVESCEFEVVEQLSLTERGTSGFGGSGL